MVQFKQNKARIPPHFTQNNKNEMGYKTLNKNTCPKKYTWMNTQKNNQKNHRNPDSEYGFSP